jgi:hypothetical protein
MAVDHSFTLQWRCHVARVAAIQGASSRQVASSTQVAGVLLYYTVVPLLRPGPGRAGLHQQLRTYSVQPTAGTPTTERPHV